MMSLSETSLVRQVAKNTVAEYMRAAIPAYTT